MLKRETGAVVRIEGGKAAGGVTARASSPHTLAPEIVGLA